MSERTLYISLVVFTLCVVGVSPQCASAKAPPKPEFTRAKPETTTLLRFPGGPIVIISPSMLRPNAKPLVSVTEMPAPFRMNDRDPDAQPWWVVRQTEHDDNATLDLMQTASLGSGYQGLDFTLVLSGRPQFQELLVFGGNLATQDWSPSTLRVVRNANELLDDLIQYPLVDASFSHGSGWGEYGWARKRGKWLREQDQAIVADYRKARKRSAPSFWAPARKRRWNQLSLNIADSFKVPQDLRLPLGLIQAFWRIADGADERQIDGWLRPYSSRVGILTTIRHEQVEGCFGNEQANELICKWRYYQVGEITWAFTFHPSGILYAAENLGRIRAWPKDIQVVYSERAGPHQINYEKMLAKFFPCFNRREESGGLTSAAEETKQHPFEISTDDSRSTGLGYSLQFHFVGSHLEPDLVLNS